MEKFVWFIWLIFCIGKLLLFLLIFSRIVFLFNVLFFLGFGNLFLEFFIGIEGLEFFFVKVKRLYEEGCWVIGGDIWYWCLCRKSSVVRILLLFVWLIWFVIIMFFIIVLVIFGKLNFFKFRSIVFVKLMKREIINFWYKFFLLIFIYFIGCW